MSNFFSKQCLHGMLCGALLSGLSLPVYAETETDIEKEQQVKVGFIYNFAKFVTWRGVDKESDTPLFICIWGHSPLSGNIALLQGKPVDARMIEVRSINNSNEQQGCHILFIADSVEERQVKQILLAVATSPILTVSDIADFIDVGGIIGMKVVDDRVRFDINLIAAQKAGLSISSQLAKLANRVVQ